MYEVSLILKAAYTGTCTGATRSLIKYLTKSNICNNSFTGGIVGIHSCRYLMRRYFSYTNLCGHEPIQYWLDCGLKRCQVTASNFRHRIMYSDIQFFYSASITSFYMLADYTVY